MLQGVDRPKKPQVTGLSAPPAWGHKYSLYPALSHQLTPTRKKNVSGMHPLLMVVGFVYKNTVAAVAQRALPAAQPSALRAHPC